MQLSAIDRITPATPIDQLPIRLELVGSRGSLVIASMLTMAAAALLMTPFALVGSLAAFQPEAFLNADVSLLAGLQLAAAFSMALVLLVFAIRRVRMAWGRSATVEIGYGVVAVNERRFGMTHRWAVPVSDFLGVAHNVRSSLSGSRHELVLVHPDPSKHVLLGLAPVMPQQQIDRVVILLGLLEIPARSIRGKGLMRAASPQPVAVPVPLAGEPAPAKLRLAA
jgi:hypothetical protein